MAPLLTPWLGTGQAQEPNAVFAFFDGLNESEFTFVEFQKNWNALEKQENSLTPKQLTRVLSSVVQMLDELKDTKSQLRKDCLSEVMFRFECWEDQAVPKIKDFEQYDLASCLRAYRILNMNPSDKFMNEWYKHAHPNAILQSKRHEHRVVRSIVSFAVAQLKPTEVFYEEWLPKAIGETPYFTPSQLAFSLWPYARFAQEPQPAFLEAWLERYNYLTKKAPQDFRQRDVANIIGSCATLHAITGKDIYKKIAEKARRLINYEACDTPQKRQIHLAALWFDWRLKITAPKPDTDASDSENNLKTLFRRCGFESHAGVIPKLNHQPDDTLVIDGRKIHIEADGPTHFLYEINDHTGEVQPAGYTGRTLFMSALIRKFSKDSVLLRLPHPLIWSIFEQNLNVQEQTIRNLFGDAAKTPAGVYHLRRRRTDVSRHTLAEHLLIRPLKIAAPAL